MPYKLSIPVACVHRINIDLIDIVMMHCSTRLNGSTLQTTSRANGRGLNLTYAAFADVAKANLATILALMSCVIAQSTLDRINAFPV